MRITRSSAWRVAAAALAGALISAPATPAFAGTPSQDGGTAPAGTRVTGYHDGGRPTPEGTRVTGVSDEAAPQLRVVRPPGTNRTLLGPVRLTYRGSVVTIWWGFDYNPKNNHLRAYAQMSSTNRRIHLQAEPLNLGDRTHLLASRRANSRTGGLVVETAAVGCHKPGGVYRSNLHYSIRWPDGRLTAHRQTGQFQAGARLICS